MLTHRIYYFFKPILPRKFAISARRKLVARKLSQGADFWPINEMAKEKPNGWTGWPEGKKFALVLTHDVEGTRGLEKCNLLIDLERKMGFRSSFNFVAEDYKVSSEVVDYLKKHGFEMGLHALTHRGNLFQSKERFRRNLPQINDYMKKWGGSGFRAPNMYHNLEMISGINIDYDSSTFDTDPFEPQPDGVNTIFPFWVQNGYKTKAFVELPYTLPQDFTLFVLMEERNIDTWKRKLDWIVDNGGMALLIAHPDYMCFDGKKAKVDEYPVEFYEKFLEYVKNKYNGEYWHVLPRDIARFWKEKMVIPQSSKSLK